MRYQVTTPLTPREALEQALADFGPGGLGLQLTSQHNLDMVFQGGGGHIAVTAQPGAKTTLELETREWDYAVKQFMAQVHRGQACAPGGGNGLPQPGQCVANRVPQWAQNCQCEAISRRQSWHSWRNW